MNTSLSPARANKIAADLARKRDALLEEIENVPAPVAPDAPPSARENTALAEAIQRDAQEGGSAHEARVTGEIAKRKAAHNKAMKTHTAAARAHEERIAPLRARLAALDEAARQASDHAAQVEAKAATAAFEELQPRYADLVTATLDTWSALVVLDQLAGRKRVCGDPMIPLFGLPEDYTPPDGFWKDSHLNEIKRVNIVDALRAREAAIVAEWRAD